MMTYSEMLAANFGSTRMNETQFTGEGSCIESGTWIICDSKLLNLKPKVENPNLENLEGENSTSNILGNLSNHVRQSIRTLRWRATHGWTRTKQEAFEVAKDEAGKLSIVQEIMIRSTDCLRRTIAPAGGQGGVTMSYLCTNCNSFLLEDHIW